MLRVIPQVLRTDGVKQNLAGLGFEVISVAKMHKLNEGNMTNLTVILVQVANTDKNKNIFNLKKCEPAVD